MVRKNPHKLNGGPPHYYYYFTIERERKPLRLQSRLVCIFLQQHRANIHRRDGFPMSNYYGTSMSCGDGQQESVPHANKKKYHHYHHNLKIDKYRL